MADTGAGAKLGIVVAGAVAIFVLVTSLYDYRSTTTASPSSLSPSSVPVRSASSASQEPLNVRLQCLAEHVENAPAPFHLSYKKSTQASNSDWETDITANSISGMVVDDAGTRAIQGIRTNGAAWGKAVADVIAPISGSQRTFALVRNSSATRRDGKEKVNGEDTVKYTIDSARDTAVDASQVDGLLGAGGFIKGAVWVTNDGCPVRLVMDAQMHMPDGNLEKEHYEAEVFLK